MQAQQPLTRLDFTQVVSHGSCTLACGEGRPRPSGGCILKWVHGFIIVDEDPQAKWVKLIIADMVNYRVVKVHLDYSTASIIACPGDGTR